MVKFMGNRIKLVLFLVFWVLAIFSNSTHLYAKQKQHTIQPGPDNGMDSYISKGCGDEHKNFGDKEDMVIGNRDNKRILLRFDLASIPPDAIISSAELQVCLATLYNFGQKVIYVHRIKGFWKDKEVTWYENKGKHNWTTPGGDFDWASIESKVSLIGITFGWVSWDVTRAVKDWFDGKDINFGFLLKQDSNDGDEIWFLSSDLEWEAYRPRLVISYEAEEVTPEPVPPAPEPVSPSVKVCPNPFKPAAGHTEVRFINLPSGALVKIFHIEGRIIRTLQEKDGEARWDVRDSEGNKVSSGFYLYRIESEKERQTGKLVIIR
jgi:hypothetical protein